MANESLRALWSNRDYVVLSAGRVISTLGSDVSALAFPLLIYALTNSALQMGLLAALRFIPYLLLSLPAGALVDRWDRKRLMITCNCARALAMSSVALALAFGRLGIWQLYAVTFVEGAFFVFFNLAETAALPRVVPKQYLPAANSQNYVTDSLADLIGPAVGGALFTAARALPFLADGLSYVGSVLSLTRVRSAFNEVRDGEPPALAPRQLAREIREGFLWLWRQPLVRFLAVLTSCMDCVMAGISLIVVVAAQQAHATALAIGFILAGGSIGALLGSAIAPRLRENFGFAPVAIGALWMVVLVWPLYALSGGPPMLALVTTLVFGAYALYDITQFSERIMLIPDALQGRVNSIFRLLVFTGLPIGQVLKGALLQSLGPSRTVLVFVIPLILLASGATLGLHVRRIGAASYAAQVDD